MVIHGSTGCVLGLSSSIAFVGRFSRWDLVRQHDIQTERTRGVDTMLMTPRRLIESSVGSFSRSASGRSPLPTSVSISKTRFGSWSRSWSISRSWTNFRSWFWSRYVSRPVSRPETSTSSAGRGRNDDHEV